MCGPFCSVPAVPTMTVVVPPAIRSRTSAHVSSSSNTVSGGFPEGAVAGALAGRCAATAMAVSTSIPRMVGRARFIMVSVSEKNQH